MSSHFQWIFLYSSYNQKISRLKMTEITSRISTRQRWNKKYGGTPCVLPSVSPSTHRDIVRYYYHILNTNSEKVSLPKICNIIKDDVKKIWFKINPNLPLITDKSIYTKIKKLIENVRKVNRKHLGANMKAHLTNLDVVFNICTCCCGLPSRPCSDKWVKCKRPNCEVEHTVCTCGALANLPAEDKVYMKELLLPSTTKKYQLGPIDRNWKPKQPKNMQKIDEIEDEIGVFSADESSNETSVSISAYSSSINSFLSRVYSALTLILKANQHCVICNTSSRKVISHHFYQFVSFPVHFDLIYFIIYPTAT